MAWADLAQVFLDIRHMEYEHHIFISYARGELWTPWVRDTFVPRLRAYLQLEVGRLEVFVDDQIQPGAQWECVLRGKVSRSMLMIALISADYFQREWCRREMALMLEREQHCGLMGSTANYGLLIPIRLGDGDSFPDLIGGLQQQDFEDFADPDLPPGTERASRFNQGLRTLAKTLARTLPQAPAQCSEAWRDFTGNGYFPQLAAKPLACKPPRLLL